MIALCPHCSADIPFDPSHASDILTCPSCHQQSAIEKPSLPPPSVTPGQSPGVIRAVLSPFDQPFHPGLRLFMVLLLGGAFVTALVGLESWLDSNASIEQSVRPAGRFFLSSMHFPMVLVTVILISEFALIFRKQSQVRSGLRYLWWWAAIFGTIAYLLGILLTRDPGLTHSPDAVSAYKTFITIMVATLHITLFIKIITDAVPGRSRALYRLLAIASLVIVWITGYFGLDMVLRENYLQPEILTEEQRN